ncbi:MAG: lysophospholipid acyltransferase family protein [Pseudomonadota bacterium]
MSLTWYGDAPPPPPRALGLRDWWRVGRRGLPLALVTFGCLGVLLLVRLVERPVHGTARPWTPWITRFVCHAAFVILGMRRLQVGRPDSSSAASIAVSNHVSWLDIFALNAGDPVYFVAKSEVASWPGIGWLARATGTVFIRRNRGDASQQAETLRARVDAGHRLLLFPEGTSTDGSSVVPFRSSLFAAFLGADRASGLAVQPITLAYTAPPDQDPRFYGWWGDMGFGAHLLHVLAAPRQGSVTVTYHTPIPVAETRDRKALARRAEDAVRAGLGSG